MKTGLLVAAGLGAVVLAAGIAAQQAQAHHAFQAEFDGDTPVLLKGTVTGVEWVNPHTWVHLLVPTAGQPDQAWMVEGGTPNTLLRMGLDKNMLKPGTQIIVRGYQAKDKSMSESPYDHRQTLKANGRDITFTNGCKVFMGSSGTGAPKDGSDASELAAGQKATTAPTASACPAMGKG